MQTYDLLMLLVLVAATIFGFWKGMAWQVASLASFIVSYFVALKFSHQLAPTFGDTAPWNRFVAMLVIYMATSFIIWNIFRMVSGVLDRVKLNAFDHQMGAMIGLAKGVLLCVAITFFAVTLLPQPQKELIVASKAGHYIIVLLDKTDTVVPEEIHQVIGPYIDRIEQQLDPSYQPATGHEFRAQWPTESPAAAPSPWPAQTVPSDAWKQPAASPSTQPTWPEQPQTADRPTGSPF